MAIARKRPDLAVPIAPDAPAIVNPNSLNVGEQDKLGGVGGLRNVVSEET